MSFASFEDNSGVIDAVIFPDLYAKIGRIPLAGIAVTYPRARYSLIPRKQRGNGRIPLRVVGAYIYIQRLPRVLGQLFGRGHALADYAAALSLYGYAPAHRVDLSFGDTPRAVKGAEKNMRRRERNNKRVSTAQ